MTDLAAEYERRCNTISDIVTHLPRLAGVVAETGAQHVIELGVRTGNSTVAFLWALAKTGGALTSVDCSEPPDIDADHWRFLFADDLDPAVVGRMPACDVLFIDTTHTYEQTTAELAAYGPLVVPGGRILLHDTDLTIGGGKPVLRAMNEWAAERGYGCVNDPRCGGLGEVYL